MIKGESVDSNQLRKSIVSVSENLEPLPTEKMNENIENSPLNEAIPIVTNPGQHKYQSKKLMIKYLRIRKVVLV